MTPSDRDMYVLGLRIAGDFGATLAVPIVLFSWLGNTLDDRWGTAPYLLVTGFVLSAVLSGYSIYRKAKSYGRALDRLKKSE